MYHNICLDTRNHYLQSALRPWFLDKSFGGSRLMIYYKSLDMFNKFLLLSNTGFNHKCLKYRFFNRRLDEWSFHKLNMCRPLRESKQNHHKYRAYKSYLLRQLYCKGHSPSMFRQLAAFGSQCKNRRHKILYRQKHKSNQGNLCKLHYRLQRRHNKYSSTQMESNRMSHTHYFHSR